MKARFPFFGRTSLAGLVVMSAGMCLAAPATAQTAADRSNVPKKLATRTGGVQFEITCAANLRNERINGRVYVMLAGASAGTEPRRDPDWFRPQPFFAVNVRNWRPDEPLRIGSGSDGFPGPPEELNPGKYAMQAVVRLNLDTHEIADGEGNLYGPIVRAKLDPQREEKVWE